MTVPPHAHGMTRDTPSRPAIAADDDDAAGMAERALVRRRLAQIGRERDERARRIRDEQESGFSETPTGRFDAAPRGGRNR